MLKLYDYFRSSASFRVRIALNIKQLDYSAVPIHLINHGGEQHSEQYKAVNPQGLVPSLQDGHHIITQSLAIIEYVNDCYPTPPLLSSDLYQRALMRSFALSIAADIHPLNNVRVLNYLAGEFDITADQKSCWYQHWLSIGLSALESQLSKWHCSGRYCFGDTPSLADICLVPQLYNARRFSCSLKAYPLLTSIDAACQEHEAFKEAWPEEVT